MMMMMMMMMMTMGSLPLVICSSRSHYLQAATSSTITQINGSSSSSSINVLLLNQHSCRPHHQSTGRQCHISIGIVNRRVAVLPDGDGDDDDDDDNNYNNTAACDSYSNSVTLHHPMTPYLLCSGTRATAPRPPPHTQL